nr:hypothetical protein [Syntrophobacteraceae bacterium]
IEGEQLRVCSDYLSPELALDEEGYFAVGDRVKATVDNRFELLGRADGAWIWRPYASISNANRL